MLFNLISVSLCEIDTKIFLDRFLQHEISQSVYSTERTYTLTLILPFTVSQSCIDGIISETMKAANKLVKDRKKGTSAPQHKAGSAAKNADAGRKTGTRYNNDLYSLIEHLI